MKTVRKKWPVARGVFFILCAVFVLFSIASGVLGYRIFRGFFFAEERLSGGVLQLLALILIVCVTIVGFFFFFVLIKSVFEGRRRKTRALLFTALASSAIAAVAVVAVCVWSLLAPLIDTWSLPGVYSYAEDGVKIINAYFIERYYTADQIAADYMTNLVIGRYRNRYNELWQLIQRRDPQAAFLQVFAVTEPSGDNGASLETFTEMGDSNQFIPIQIAANIPDGAISVCSGEIPAGLENIARDKLIYTKTLRTGKNEFKCVYGSVFFNGFDEAVSAISEDNKQRALIRERSGSIRQICAFALCALIFPPLFMLFSLLYIISARLASFTEVSAEAVVRRRSGSESLYIVHSRVSREENNISEFINNPVAGETNAPAALRGSFSFDAPSAGKDD